MYFSPKTSADGLVFHYDTGNTVRSYLGEPTVNLLYSAGATNLTNGAGDIYGRCTKTDLGNGKYRFVNNGTGVSTVRVYTNQGDLVNGATYACSVYYENLVGGIGIDWCDTGITGLNYSTNVSGRLGGYGTRGTYDGPYYFLDINFDSGGAVTLYNPQVEYKSHVTPFVAGTRSATQGLKDLTGKSTIDLTNVSFDANAQMTFDGTNDAISVTTPSGFSGSGTWTLNTWFKINGAPSSNVYMNVILDMNPTGGSANMICVNWSDMRLQYRSRPVGGSYTDINGSILTQGVWYNATVVKNGASDTKLYLNGVQDGGTYSGDLPAGNQSTFNIGRWTDGTVFANATIPVIHIYNRALTADEVARNFNAIKSRFNIG